MIRKQTRTEGAEANEETIPIVQDVVTDHTTRFEDVVFHAKLSKTLCPYGIQMKLKQGNINPLADEKRSSHEVVAEQMVDTKKNKQTYQCNSLSYQPQRSTKKVDHNLGIKMINLKLMKSITSHNTWKKGINCVDNYQKQIIDDTCETHHKENKPCTV